MKAIKGLAIFGWNYPGLDACSERVRMVAKRFRGSKIEKFKKAAEMLEKESIQLNDAAHRLKNMGGVIVPVQHKNNRTHKINRKIKKAVDTLERFGLLVEIVNLVECVYKLYEGAFYSSNARGMDGKLARDRADVYINFVKNYIGIRYIGVTDIGDISYPAWVVRKAATEYMAEKLFGKKPLEE